MALFDESRAIPDVREPHPSDHDEVELLHRIAAGDRQSFADLYDALSEDIRHLAAATFADSRAVEAVVAATFLQLWRQAPTPDPARVRAWLVNVASNLIAQRVKTRSPRLGHSVANRPAPWAALSSTLDDSMGAVLASRLNRRTPRESAERRT